MKIFGKILSRKISIGITIASLFVVAALVYSLGYNMAMRKFNNIVGYTQEKQKMYSKLSEVDYNIRDSYIGKIDEDKLFDSTCSGYIKGLADSNAKFLSSADYKSYKNEQENLSGDVEVTKLSNDTSVIRCLSLGKNFSGNFITSLNNLASEGVKGVIVDLRGCSKGNEQELAIAVQHLADKGDVIYTLDANDNKEVLCSSSSERTNIKLVVLVNDETSGFAEVFASALKDSCGAKVVGVETAGNAVRTKAVNLSDDSVIVFPDAFYLTSGGKKIFKKGLQPDINVVNRSNNEDTQMQEAVSALEKML